MRRSLVFVGTALVSLLIANGSALAAAAPPEVVPRASAYAWYWSDVNYGTNRTFTQRQYGSAENLPRLIVEADCSEGAREGDTIKLQWRYRGKYVTEDSKYVSDCYGKYSLKFNPYTDDGRWAGGRYLYRLIIPGGVGVQQFQITYAKR
jgi:hypothetical protein